MNKISKPHLVDFLRLADHNKWFSPRIRYASVRSKPELTADLLAHFDVNVRKGLLRFDPKRPGTLPVIAYCLERRTFLIDGERVNVPKASREKPAFVISHEPRTVDFALYQGQTPPPTTETDAASSSESEGPSIDVV